MAASGQHPRTERASRRAGDGLTAREVDHTAAVGRRTWSSGREDGPVHHYPDAVGVDEFLVWTSLALGTHGFSRETSLPLVSVCRDELMFPFVDAITAHWGHCFDLSSLAGLPLLGRTGVRAALGHTPDEDGRHRLVVFAFPHIGVDGFVGSVHRPGVPGETTACGAISVARTALERGVSGVVLDPHDIEESLLVARLREVLGDGTVPGLVELTELVRQAAVEELVLLLSDLGTPQAPVDVALVSGVVLHGPETDSIALASASVDVGGRTTRLDLPRA
jgi:hypothetical protein